MVETGYGGLFGISVPVRRFGSSFESTYIDVPAEGFHPPEVPPQEATHAYVGSERLSGVLGRLGSGVRLGVEMQPHNGNTGAELIIPIDRRQGTRLVRM